MKALITGASGFVGFELVRHLPAHGHRPIAAVGPPQHAVERARLERLRSLGLPLVELDLRRAAPLADLPSDWEVLFHLAGYVRTEERSPEVAINDQGTQRLLEQVAGMLGGRRVVYASSLAAVDSTPPSTARLTLDTPCRPRTAYGASKLAGEAVVREFTARNGAGHTIFRFPTVYGPEFRPGGMFDVLARDLPRARLAVRLDWPGRLSLLEVQDAARLLTLAASHPGTRDRTFLVSSGEDPTMGEIIACAAGCLGTRWNPVPLPGLAFGVLRRLLGGWWQAPWISHRIQIATWRASLVLNGLYGDGSELTRLLDFSYTPWRAGFTRMFAENPRGLGGSTQAVAGRSVGV